MKPSRLSLIAVLALLLIAVPALLGQTGRSPKKDPHPLIVLNGSGSGSYVDGELVPIEAQVPDNYEFVKWFKVEGPGSLNGSSSPSATFTMGYTNAIVVAVLARIETWFPPGVPSKATNGLLLPKPIKGEAKRIEQAVRVTLLGASETKIPKYPDVWKIIQMKLAWEKPTPVDYFTKNKDGKNISNKSNIPKDEFKLKSDAYEASIWYEGKLTSEEMSKDAKAPTVDVALKLVVEGKERSKVEKVKLLPMELLVDANRDGKLNFESSAADKTSKEKPFRFWINEDDDRNDEDHPGSSKRDCGDDDIRSARDLEDFTRLWIKISAFHKEIAEGKMKVAFKWGDEGSGEPGIKIYKAESKEGTDDYLKEEETAKRQLGDEFKKAVATVSGDSSVELPKEFWTGLSEDKPQVHLLFEGTAEGKKPLVLTFTDANGKELGQSQAVWLEITDIKKMYVSNDDNKFKTAPAGEAEQTLVFVHGWNMSPDGSRNYAETMFKRLWHRGFKGRFAYFRWNTYSSSSWKWAAKIGEGIDAFLAKYNDSEYIAWQSAPALKSFVESLPYANKNIAAHSMGNIVASEAIRLGMSVNNYALMQAAVPAACYDSNESVRQRTQYWHSTFQMWESASPDADEDDVTRSLAYRGTFNSVGEQARLVNFYLPEDSATSFWWELNNDQTKPPLTEALFCVGVEYFPTGQPGRKLWKLVTSPYFDTSSLTYVITNKYEAMSYACRTWGKATGAFGETAGAIKDSINLGENKFKLPNESKAGFGENHSGQFDANIQNLKAFYDTLMDTFGAEPTP